MPELTFQDGVAFWKDTPLYLITAEYPYFRDNPANWEQRLRQIASLGAGIISTYIPWRHHELLINGERVFDFSGRTLPNRDVLGFIGLCRGLGLKLILKPGPFCHAELNYGGLPDFVCPLQRPDIEPNLKGDNSPVTWVGSQPGSTGAPLPWPLPSADSPVYKAEVRRWFQAVRSQVLLENCAPSGPVVATQVGNEGIYSDAQHAVWSHDYSRCAQEEYRRWLEKRYGSIGAYNSAHHSKLDNWSEIEPPSAYTAPPELAGLRAYTDWAEYSGYSLGSLFTEYAAWLDLPVPALTNVNPPTADAWGIDAWLSRVQPGKWKGVEYGYTNWIGVAAEDASALARYMLLTRRAAGPNLEENWGFGKIYDPRYEKASVCFQQTLVAIAGGTTGYNIYTAVGTTDWDEEIDRFMEKPYPSHAPIGPDKVDPDKAKALADLNGFLNEFGAEYLNCAPVTGVAWGLYQPYAHLGAWCTEADNGMWPEVAGHTLPVQGPALMAVQQKLIEDGRDLAYLDLETATVADLARYKLLIMAGGPYMDAATQHSLAEFTREGGTLALIGEVPALDEQLEPFRELAGLKEESRLMVFPDQKQLLAALPELLNNVRAAGLAIEAPGKACAWLRENPAQNLQFLVILSNLAGEVRITYSRGEEQINLALDLPDRGGAIVRLDRGKVSHMVIGGEVDTPGTYSATTPGA